MPFQKGVSGNPGGRKKKAITIYLEKIIEETEPKSGKEFAEIIARRLVIDAANGNQEAQKILLDRLEGKPHQTTDITSGGDKLQTLLVEFINKKDEKDTNTNGV